MTGNVGRIETLHLHGMPFSSHQRQSSRIARSSSDVRRPTPIAIRCRIWFCAIASLAIPPAFVATAADKLSFNRNVRPILAENCFACHGPDSASRKAGLRLDRREVAVKIGAIMPGNPDESEMIHRIFASDDDERMPPPRIHKQLTAAQKERLKAWIAAGAEYQPLWSFIQVSRQSGSHFEI